MIWRILGPDEVVQHGRAVDVGRPQQRAVLAYLLLSCGQVVRVDQLVAALWADTPPVGAHRQVRVRVAQIRSALRDTDLAGALTSVAGGYRLMASEAEFDAAAFAAYADRARAATAAGQPALAATQLREGLELWRGPALAGLPEPTSTPRRPAWTSSGWPRLSSSPTRSWRWADVSLWYRCCDRSSMPIRCGSVSSPSSCLRWLAAVGRRMR